METHFNGIAFATLNPINPTAAINILKINPNIILYRGFSLNTFECLIYHQ